MSKKLKKTQKGLPAFGWDTEPVVGNEEVIEEAFVDVFCDLVYGGGWMDLERDEELDRDCNWALVSNCYLIPNFWLFHSGMSSLLTIFSPTRSSLNPFHNLELQLQVVLIHGQPQR